MLLDVVAEGLGGLGIVLRAGLRRAGVNQGVPRNDVDGLLGGLGDFLEQVAEVGVGGERRKGGFDAEVTDLGDFFGRGFDVGSGRRRSASPTFGFRQDFVGVNGGQHGLWKFGRGSGLWRF